MKSQKLLKIFLIAVIRKLYIEYDIVDCETLFLLGNEGIKKADRL